MILDLTKEKVLITGSSGFLGHHVVDLFRERGCELILPWSKEYNLLKESQVAAMYQRHDPSVVIHLAAVCGGIGANSAQPGRFFYDNMLMGMNVIHCAHKHNESHNSEIIKKLIMLGTVCSYPKHTPTPFQEHHLWDGYPEETNAPYGIAKKSLLVMLQAYHRQYGLNGCFLMPVNLYGEHDNFDPQSSHVIPAMIRKFHEAKLAGEPVLTLWGTGEASREFLYAKDAAKAIWSAAMGLSSTMPMNIGSGRTIKIKDLAFLIARIVGYTGEVRFDCIHPDGQPSRQLDVSRALHALGWEASTSLEEGLERVVRWFRWYQARVTVDSIS